MARARTSHKQSYDHVTHRKQKSPKTPRVKARRGAPRDEDELLDVLDIPRRSDTFTLPPQKRDTTPLTPKNEKQAHYINSMRANTLTFGMGPAGTGKTFCSVSFGCELLEKKEVEYLVFVRPAVGAGENLGATPGELADKYGPWVMAIRAVLDRRLGTSHVEYLIKIGRIRFQPFTNMRGLDWENSFIVLSEAQNTTPEQMKLILTRIGNGSRVVVEGDVTQKDNTHHIKYYGLDDALTRMVDLPTVGLTTFENSDSVRSGFVRLVLDAYAA